jgi:hypothetical protein
MDDRRRDDGDSALEESNEGRDRVDDRVDDRRRFDDLTAPSSRNHRSR